SLDWNLVDYPDHRDLQVLVSDLNRIYRDEPALWEADTDPAGFRWLDAGGAQYRPPRRMRMQFLAAGAQPLSRRRARPRILSRDSQHRLGCVWRDQCWQHVRRRGRRDSVARIFAFDHDPDAAACGDLVLHSVVQQPCPR